MPGPDMNIDAHATPGGRGSDAIGPVSVTSTPARQNTIAGDPPVTRMIGPKPFHYLPSMPSGPSADARRAACLLSSAVRAIAGQRGLHEPEGRRERDASQATLEQYLERGLKLLQRYRRECQIGATDEELSPIDWVVWVLSLRPTLEASTWRHYRQAVIHFLQRFPGVDAQGAIALIEADAASGPWRPLAAGAIPTTRASSLPMNSRLRYDDYDHLLAHLSFCCRSKWAPVLIDWLRVELLTGLRPTEWQATDLEVRDDPEAEHGRRVWLYVLNRKLTTGYGNGVIRTLDLSALGDADLGCIERMVRCGRGWAEEGRFARAQGAVAELLYRTCARDWPIRTKRYGLESARLQAIANAATVLTPDEMRAVFGIEFSMPRRLSPWPDQCRLAVPRAVLAELKHVRASTKLLTARRALERKARLRR